MDENLHHQEQILRRFMGCRGMLFGYLQSIVQDFHVAEDLLQDVMLIILKKNAQLEDMDDFAAWARRIATFEALNAVRKANRRKTRSLSPDALELLEETWQEEDRESEPRRIAALRACLEGLAPRARQIVHERYFEGATGQKLADTMGLTLNSANASLTKVHRQLEECISGRLGRKGIP